MKAENTFNWIIFISWNSTVFYFSHATKDPEVSVEPPAHYKYQQNKSGFDKRGGGGVIPCIYTLKIKPGDVTFVKEKFMKLTMKGISCETS